MIDFSLFDKALKTTWVKRLCSDDTRPWKFIPLSLLSNVGETLLFQCHYDIKYLDINEHLPKFYRDIILQWQEINTTTPNEKGDILNQVIWNNRFIRINKALVYFPNWNQAGVQKLSCFFNDEGNSQSSLNAFVQTFNLKCNFLQYYGLLSAIPSEWKTILKQEDYHHVKQPPNMSLEIGKLSCKAIYSELTNCQNFPPATAEKRLIEKVALTLKKGKNFLSAPVLKKRWRIYSSRVP